MSRGLDGTKAGKDIEHLRKNEPSLSEFFTEEVRKGTMKIIDMMEEYYGLKLPRKGGGQENGPVGNNGADAEAGAGGGDTGIQGR